MPEKVHETYITFSVTAKVSYVDCLSRYTQCDDTQVVIPVGSIIVVEIDVNLTVRPNPDVVILSVTIHVAVVGAVCLLSDMSHPRRDSSRRLIQCQKKQS